MRLCFSISLAILVALVGCGRKGPPVPPAVVVPPAIRDLNATTLGNSIQLHWSVPARGGAPLEGIRSFRVFRHVEKRSAPLCPGCPLSFDKLHEIKMSNPAPARIDHGRMVYSVGSEPGLRYAFKVLAVHQSGGVSDDSNVVRMPAQ
jgi:predicted small lipoprotein YifL